MAIEYSGWIEVPRGEGFGGGTVNIPFTFQSDSILAFQERIDRLNELYGEWRALLTDYDERRQGQYGDIARHRFTSVVDLGYQTPANETPHFGK